MSIDIRKRLSYSSISSYAECGERFKLSRAYHLDRQTWFTTVLGTTVHYMTEQHDLGNPVPKFLDQFKHDLEVERDKGNEVKASGREGKELSWSGGPNKKDYEWAVTYGPQMFDAYVQWRKDTPNWEIPTVIGQDGNTVPAIELGFNIEAGGIPIRGYIDRVFVDNVTGSVIVYDLKTGALPKSPIQAVTYKVGLKRAYGVDAQFAVFAGPYQRYRYEEGPRGGKKKIPDGIAWGNPPEQMHELGQYTEEYLDYLYEKSALGIEMGIFLPSPSQYCGGCPVRKYCRAQGGDKAMSYPVHDIVNFYEDEGTAQPEPDDIVEDEE